MPTPVGPTSADPDDPDSWDWGEFGTERRRASRWQIVAVCLVVLGLVLLLVVNVT